MADVTVLAIFNGALSLVTTEQVTDVREGNVPAAACRSQYGPAYDRVLTRVPWNFAHKKTQLDEVTGSEDLSPEAGFTYLYDKPDDFERLWTWAGSITPEGYGAVQIEGERLRSAMAPPLPLSYIYRVPLNKVSESFVGILQFVLAEMIKPRFQQRQVGANALTARELRIQSEMLIRESRAIELAQMKRSKQPLSTLEGRRPRFARDPYER